MLQLVLGIALAQDPKITVNPADTHGKTPEQIVAMGYDNWYDFYIGKEQAENTMSMSAANSLYGNSLYLVNSKKLSKLALERQKSISALRERLVTYRDACVEVGYVRSGGGTLWTLVSSSTRSESEQLVAELIAGNQKGFRGSQANVWQKWKEVHAKIESGKEDLESAKEFTNRGYAEAKNAATHALLIWSEDIALIAKFPKVAEREKIMGFYLSGAELAWESDM